MSCSKMQVHCCGWPRHSIRRAMLSCQSHEVYPCTALVPLSWEGAYVFMSRVPADTGWEHVKFFRVLSALLSSENFCFAVRFVCVVAQMILQWGFVFRDFMRFAFDLKLRCARVYCVLNSPSLRYTNPHVEPIAHVLSSSRSQFPDKAYPAFHHNISSFTSVSGL